MFLHNLYRKQILTISNTPYFSLLKSRLDFLNDRQKVLADNVANASTPKFVPKDLDEKAFNQNISKSLSSNSGIMSIGNIGPVTMPATHSGHISIGNDGTKYQSLKSPDSETTIDGNAVVLEEQMIKVSDTRMNYDIAIGLYQKGLQLMRLAARKPGG